MKKKVHNTMQQGFSTFDVSYYEIPIDLDVFDEKIKFKINVEIFFSDFKIGFLVFVIKFE